MRLKLIVFILLFLAVFTNACDEKARPDHGSLSDTVSISSGETIKGKGCHAEINASYIHQGGTKIAGTVRIYKKGDINDNHHIEKMSVRCVGCKEEFIDSTGISFEFDTLSSTTLYKITIVGIFDGEECDSCELNLTSRQALSGLNIFLREKSK